MTKEIIGYDGNGNPIFQHGEYMTDREISIMYGDQMEISIQDELGYYKDRVFRRYAQQLTMDVLFDSTGKYRGEGDIPIDVMPQNFDYQVDEDDPDFQDRKGRTHYGDLL